MGSPADLTLSTQAHTPTTNVFKSSSSFPGHHLERMRTYLQALEAERLKIEAFKRELPLCMQLVDETIESSKKELAENRVLITTLQPLQLRSSSMDESDNNLSGESGQRGLEFMPLKRRWERRQRDEDDDMEGDQSASPSRVSTGRPAWMADADQLRRQQGEPLQVHHEERTSPETVGRNLNFGQSEQEQSSRLLLSSKQRPAGAFLPFIRERQVTIPLVSNSTTATGCGADLSLSSLDQLSSPNGHQCGGGESEVGISDVTLRTADQMLDVKVYKEMRPKSNGVSGVGSTTVDGSQSQRKSRRCWSPELHRRFVGALQQLGGCQVATPKQIRELMKVDGLTNDEVKSHLQKYRLHTRKSPPSPSESLQGPQLVMLKGIWVPPECAAVVAVAEPSLGEPYETLQQSLYCQPSHPQDYFTCNNSNGSSRGQFMHHPPIVEPQKSTSVSQTSPQGPLQLTSQLSGGTQELSNEESGGEDVKSDSTSWKGCKLDDEGKENAGNKRTAKESNDLVQSRDKTSIEDYAEHNSPVLELQISCGSSEMNIEA